MRRSVGASADSATWRVLAADPLLALQGQLQPAAASFSADARGSGSTFCLARFQWRELEGVKGKGMEWGERREQEKGLIFLTPTPRHQDVWALWRTRAAAKRSHLKQDLRFSSDVIQKVQSASAYCTIPSCPHQKAHISRCLSELFSVCVCCWFSWSLPNAWQPTDMPRHWALVCDHDSRESERVKNTQRGERQSRG